MIKHCEDSAHSVLLLSKQSNSIMNHDPEIQRYLNGAMDEEERLKFESQIEHSPDLQEEVEFSRQLDQALNNSASLNTYQIIFKVNPAD